MWGREATAGGHGDGIGGWPAEALAAVYGTYSSGGKNSIIGNIGRGSAGLHGITDTSPSGYSSM